MDSSEIERRASLRFNIPGATVSYKKKKLFFTIPASEEENCPLANLSRRGLQFLCQKPLKKNNKVLLKITFPEDKDGLLLKGTVGSTIPCIENNFNYQVRIHLNLYGGKKGQNSPKNLVKIIALEHKYAKEKTSLKEEKS